MKKHLLFIFSTATLLASCVSTNYLSIDIRRPAVVTFDSTVVNLVVVDNAASMPDANDVSDEERMSSQKEIQLVTLPLDSAKWALTKGLAQFMDEEKYFGKVSRYRINMRDDSDFEKDRPLTKGQISTICEQTDADAVISIDKFLFSSTLDKYENPYTGATDDVLAMRTGIVARAYTAQGKLLEPEVTVLDSLFWQGSSYMTRNGYKPILPLPELEEASIEMAVHTADKLVDYFIPSWQTQTRWYYSNSGNMKKAGKLAQGGKWAEAAEAWRQLFDKEKNPLRKARLASNIALANEYLDDIENARHWIDAAFELIPSHGDSKLTELTTIYKKVLIERERYSNKLKEQVGD